MCGTGVSRQVESEACEPPHWAWLLPRLAGRAGAVLWAPVCHMQNSSPRRCLVVGRHTW